MTFDQKTQNAFTLVELLVVIAIISILAGMLMPALEEAIDSARAIKCTSNLKQLMHGFHAYTSDSDGISPLCEQPTEYLPHAPAKQTPVINRWFVSLRKYVGSGFDDLTFSGVLTCDSAKPGSSPVNYSLPYPWRFRLDEPTRSYGGGISIANVGHPSGVIAYTDAVSRFATFTARDQGHPGLYFDVYNNYGYYKYLDIPDTGGADSCNFVVHKEGMNCSFIDGHAGWMPYNILYENWLKGANGQQSTLWGDYDE